MALSCIISEIKLDIGRKSRLFHTPAFDAPVMGSRRNIATPFGMEKPECYPTVKKSLRICLAVSTEYQRVTDRQTDRQTDILGQHGPRYALHRAVKMMSY